MTGPAVVPAAPPALIITPNDRVHDGTPPGTSAVEAATRAALRNLEANGTAVPADGQPRRADGTFAPTAGQPAPAAAPAAPAAPASPEAPNPVEAKPAPAGETPEQKAAREAAEAAAAPAAEEAIETPEQIAARELEERTVTLVGRNNSEYEFVAPDKETAEVLRGLRNGYARGEEIREARAEIEGQIAEVNELRTNIELDPVGFLMETAQQTPEVIDHLVLYLASQPEHWTRLGPQLMKLADAAERRTVAAEQKSARFELRDQVAMEAESRATVRKNLEDVQSTVGSMLPTEMSADQQTVLYRDCLHDLKEYAERHHLHTIPVKDIPALLATRLTAYGINPVEAAARAADVAVRRGKAPGRPAPASPRAPAPPAPVRAAAPAPTGKQFVVSASKKAAAGAIPSGGAGSPAGIAPMTPPKNPDGSKMTTEQTLVWHRGEVAKGVRRA